MELIHVATLIHDDVVDNAQTRRGVNATAVDFGNRVSVLAGDYLFAWIFKNVTAGLSASGAEHSLARRSPISATAKCCSCRRSATSRSTLDEYVEVARKKTASLFAASAECGAIMGGGSAATDRSAARLRRRYGIAFQMNDDLLDMTADERSLGKPVGNDLTEHKMTIPLMLALRGGDREFHDDGRAFLCCGVRQSTGIPPIVAAIAREGGFEATRAEIAALCRARQGRAGAFARERGEGRIGAACRRAARLA